MITKEIQKELMIESYIFSPIPSLYDDDQVCSAVDCELFKNLQFVSRPSLPNYDEYSEKFRNSIYEFLYSNKTSSEVLNKINDITEIYYISLYNSINMIIIFSMTIIISVVMILSLSFLYIEKLKACYASLPNSFWYVLILGFILKIYGNLMIVEEVTPLKCQLRKILSSSGLQFHLVPFLYLLIINFPIENKFSRWIYLHKFKYLSIVITQILVLSLLNFMSRFKEDDGYIISNDKKYQFCVLENKFGSFIGFLWTFTHIITFTSIIILIFIEWNITKIDYDIRLLLATFSLSFIQFLIFIVINSLNINYIIQFYFNSYIILTITIFSYVLLYLIRIIFAFISFRNEENEILDAIKNNFQSTENPESSIGSSYRSYKTNNLKRSNSKISKFLELHFVTSLSSQYE